MYTATITSKRQFTIPADLFRQMNFEIGQKVIVSRYSDTLNIQPASLLVERLAGSVRIPVRFKGKSVDQIIQIAKKEHFQKAEQA